MSTCITIFESIIVLRGIDNIMWNIPPFKLTAKIFCRILSVPQNIVMDHNNVMYERILRFIITSRVQEYQCMYNSTMVEWSNCYCLPFTNRRERHWTNVLVTNWVGIVKYFMYVAHVYVISEYNTCGIGPSNRHYVWLFLFFSFNIHSHYFNKKLKQLWGSFRICPTGFICWVTTNTKGLLFTWCNDMKQ